MVKTMIRLQLTGISVARVFQVDPEKAWALLTDTVRWPGWGPSVRRVDCPERHIRRGSRGRIRTPLGLSLPFVVTEYRHGRFWAWRVAGIPATGHRLVPLGPAACRVSFEMPVFWLPYVPVCAAALKKMAPILER